MDRPTSASASSILKSLSLAHSTNPTEENYRMTTTLMIKWLAHNSTAENLIEDACEHLDLRKKALKGKTQNKRIIASILAQRSGDFKVSYKHIHRRDKDAVKAALECLCGPVLIRCKGTEMYALREAYRPLNAFFTTEPPAETKGRHVPAVSTAYGTIYRDGSQGEVPFEDIKVFGYARPSLLQIVAPYQHWWMFVDDLETPSVNWKTIDETDHEHPIHDELMDLIALKANMRGIQTIRHGHDGFLCINPDALLFVVDTTITQRTNRSGNRPLLNIKDTYGRTHVRWGTSANKSKGINK